MQWGLILKRFPHTNTLKIFSKNFFRIFTPMEEMIQAIIDELRDEATIEVSETNGLLIIKALWGNETRKLVLRHDDDFHVIADWATELINDMQNA
jgi:CRISPR/Cas system endoribonuclease Cas6 (RAMP superfamily)